MNGKYIAEGVEHGAGGTGSEIASHLDQFSQDTMYLASIRPELQNKYPDHWVAVYEKKIIATAPTLKEVMRTLQANKIPTARAVVDFLRAEPIAMVLQAQ